MALWQPAPGYSSETCRRRVPKSTKQRRNTFMAHSSWLALRYHAEYHYMNRRSPLKHRSYFLPPIASVPQTNHPIIVKAIHYIQLRQIKPHRSSPHKSTCTNSNPVVSISRHLAWCRRGQETRRSGVQCSSWTTYLEVPTDGVTFQYIKRPPPIGAEGRGEERYSDLVLTKSTLGLVIKKRSFALIEQKLTK